MNQTYFIRKCLNAVCQCRYPVGTDKEVAKLCIRCNSETQLLGYPFSIGSESSGLRPAFSQLELVSDNIRSAWNIGSLFRTCDGMGVHHFHLTGISPTPENPKVRKTSLGSEVSVNWSYSQNCPLLVHQLKRKGYTIVVLEKNDKSVLLTNTVVSRVKEPICFVCGNEKWGVDPEVQRLADYILELPMVGIKESFNVAVATGLALYKLQFG